MTPDLRPTAPRAPLTSSGLDCGVIGGIPLALHGSDRDTFDLDICPATDPGNFDALGRALLDIDAKLRGIEDDIPFVPDSRVLAGMEILTLDTSFGPLDVLIRPDGSPPYRQLRARADRLEVGTVAVLVASIDDLLEMKRRSPRDKDNFDVETLE